MVLSRIPEERRTVRRRTKPLANYGTKTHVPHKIKEASYAPSPSTTRSASLTTAIANETLSSTSSSTDDTLSMISTPWSTETWKSQSVSVEYSSPSWHSSEHGSSTSITIAPKSTTTPTYGYISPNINTGSNLTVTLLGDVLSSQSGSRYVPPLMRQNSGSSPTYASWTLETYTSTGRLSSFDREGLKVNYPWSPSTFISGTEFTDYYPSSLTLISQKGSRVGFGKFEAKKPLTPMNYIVLTKDDHPMLDWILVKQKGILIRKEQKK